MASLNKVMLIGNLTRKPSLTFTPSGVAVVDVGLAINRNWTDDQGVKQEEVTFVDVTFWGRTAENVEKYCDKGSSLYVEGRLTVDSWEDKDTGKKRNKLKIIGGLCQFLTPKSGGGGGGGQSTREQSQSSPPASEAPAGGVSEEDDDIPF